MHYLRLLCPDDVLLLSKSIVPLRLSDVNSNDLIKTLFYESSHKVREAKRSNDLFASALVLFSFSDVLKRKIAYAILPPVLEIEVPPLRVVHREAILLHGAAQQIAVVALQRRAAELIRTKAIRQLVITADHLDRRECSM